MKQLLKYCFIICLVALHAKNGFSQSIDSLKLALKNAKHDTTRCNLLSLLAATASDEEWPAFNEQLKVLAEKHSSENSSLKNFYSKHLADAYGNIGFIYGNQGNIPKALEFNQKSLEIRKNIRDKIGMAESFNNIGYVYYSEGDIPTALEYFQNSLRIKVELGDKIKVATALHNIGGMYDKLGDVSKALEYDHKSLKIREELGDKLGIAGSLINIGSIYFKQGDVTKAFEYSLKSLKIEEEIGDKRGIANCLNNLGNMYAKQGNMKKALEYNERSLSIRKEINDKVGVAESSGYLGNLYKEIGEFEKALDYYNSSLKMHQEIGDKQGIGTALAYNANILVKTGQINEALVLALKSMAIAKEIGYTENLQYSAQTLKAIFIKQNKHKEAFEMYELEIKMRDSINNQETQKAAVKKQMQYTYEKKELEMKTEQNKKDVIAAEELKQKEKERNYFIAGFALVMVLALFILKGYREKQKDNKIITHQKHLVEEKQKEILDSIHYAKRIQTALMTNEKQIDKTLNRLGKN